MAIPPLLALQAAQKAGTAVRGDLAVIRYQRPPRTRGKGKKKVTMPGREVEIHVSPVAIGVGVLALGAAATLGAIVWYGVKIPTLLGSIEIVPGVKDGAKALYAKDKKALQEWYSKKSKPRTGVATPMFQSTGNPYPEGSWYWTLWNSTH
jgi:hypothetical protein